MSEKVLIDRELLAKATMLPSAKSMKANRRDIEQRRRAQAEIRKMLAAATGNLREDAAVAGLGSQDAADQDRDRRNEVAMALGLMNNGDFSWAFLLQKIRECAKASGHEYKLPFRLQR